MPIYEFTCSKCKTGFEKIVPTGTKTSVCPKCGSQDTVKKLSPFSSIVKSGAGACPAADVCTSPKKHPSCCSCCH